MFLSAITKIINKSKFDYDVKLRKHAKPAVQMDVYRNGAVWFSADLVAVCRISQSDLCFVAKPYKLLNDPVELNSFDDNTWSCSFSLKEKQLFDGMDRDNGCRKAAMRVLKALLGKNAELKCLTSYHVKTILMHNLRDSPYSSSERWWPQNRVLGARVMELLCDLWKALEYRRLRHYFVPEENLFGDIKDIVLDNMAHRVKRLWENKREMLNILGSLTIQSESSYYSHHEGRSIYPVLCDPAIARTRTLGNPGWPQGIDDEFRDYQDPVTKLFWILMMGVALYFFLSNFIFVILTNDNI